MSVKEVQLPKVGLVKIYKRRGLKNMRISLPHGDYVRLTMPSWLPYKTGLLFIHQKQKWILAHKRPKHNPTALRQLKSEAEKILPARLDKLAKQYGYTYNKLRIRYLKSRWGSCNETKDISLNVMLMQLPEELIDHVLLHELIHTEIHRHGADFWKEFEKHIPQAKLQRKTLRTYHTNI